jgi:hypothetical protein
MMSVKPKRDMSRIAHRVEDAVQVVALVLHHARVKAADLAADRVAERIEAVVAEARIPRHDAAQPGNRQAPFPILLDLVGQRREHRIDELGVRHRLGIRIAVALLEAEDDDLLQHADLRRGKPRTVLRGIVSRMSCSSASSSGVPKASTGAERCRSCGLPMRNTSRIMFGFPRGVAATSSCPWSCPDAR